MLRSVFWLGVALLALCPFAPARADLGPKPTISFTFSGSQSAALDLSKATLFICEKGDCSDAKPLRPLGPQRLTCEATSCLARAYGFLPYLRLEVPLKNGRTVTSAVFTKQAFDAKISVTFDGASLQLVENKEETAR